MCKPHLKHMRKRWMAGSEWGEHLQCSNSKSLSLSLCRLLVRMLYLATSLSK